MQRISCTRIIVFRILNIIIIIIIIITNFRFVAAEQPLLALSRIDFEVYTESPGDDFSMFRSGRSSKNPYKCQLSACKMKASLRSNLDRSAYMAFSPQRSQLVRTVPAASSQMGIVDARCQQSR